ncbi:hypothetical protein DUNSADRAFT_12853 [Dunaliella salina]|uniref:Guanylate cyclase domain-containing protein n=1 Tax=Dunaliella salina TaxID=3046 RepID=A0ABQ7H9Q6_DUNSA|nr:hypothetical protein DUNSADRAFT_12853 [Dunaliella salina]|eukprot:KAF5843591.1 hypothetical protein DUNSADRAFT_12853 [Dunaliella salina]
MKRAKTVTSGFNAHSKESADTTHSLHSGNVVVLNMGNYCREPPTLEEKTSGARRELKTVPTFGTSNARDAAVVGVEGGDIGKEHPTSLLLFQVIPSRKLPQAVSWGGNLNLSPNWKPTLSSQAFFSAPGALQALQGTPDEMPIVTAVFAAVSSFHMLEESHPAEAANISDEVTQLVLRMLRQVDGGYLCRSFGGCKFMLTDEDGSECKPDSIQAETWVHNTKAYASSRMHARGCRMKMGLNEGKPDSIQPDYLGRGDYNGDVVNQASRFMEGAAAGGMVSCDEQLARRVFHHWNKRAAQLDLLPLALVHDSYCVSTPSDPELELHGSMSTGGTGGTSSGLTRGDSDTIVSPKQLVHHERRNSLLHHQHSLQLLQREQQAAPPRVVPVGAGESQESLFQERGAKDQAAQRLEVRADAACTMGASTSGAHLLEASTNAAHTPGAQENAAQTGEARAGAAHMLEDPTGVAHMLEASTSVAHALGARANAAQTGEARADAAHMLEDPTGVAHMVGAQQPRQKVGRRELMQLTRLNLRQVQPARWRCSSHNGGSGSISAVQAYHPHIRQRLMGMQPPSDARSHSTSLLPL